MLRLGIDTGGTYTDAVLMSDADEVIACAKALTTHDDLVVGIRGALAKVLDSGHGPISLACLSTTLATNAIVEGRGASAGLVMVGSERALMGRAGLSDALSGDPALHLAGGHDASGGERTDLDLASLQPWLESNASAVTAFAVCAEFGNINPSHELAVRDTLRAATGLPVTCAHELSSRLNAPRRALTALLNARLLARITSLMSAVEGALADWRIDAPLMVVKGDGSLIHVDMARERPVETILSGPAASVVGAAHLAGASDLMVADIGGTTTDIAILEGGRPRLDPRGARVGGLATMVNAAAVHSVGLGGDSEVGLAGNHALCTGPRRIMPIARLAVEHPQVVTLLGDVAATARNLTIDHVRFVWRDPHTQVRTPRLRRDEHPLWNRLQTQPVHAASVAPDRYSSGVLDSLIRRGAVAVAGLTPTDAAHVLGLEDTGSRGGAIAVHRAWLALLECNGSRVDATPEALAERVLNALASNIAMALLDTAFETRPLPGVERQDWNGSQRLLRHALNAQADPDDSLLSLRPALSLPVAAVGASARTHFPGVQRHLAFSLEIPPHADVSNALGAVVGSVVQSVQLRITSPAAGIYRLHGDTAPLDYAQLDIALEAARARACEKARAAAARAGAPDAAVSAHVQQRSARIEGEQMFVEAIVTATAKGRPAHAA